MTGTNPHAALLADVNEDGILDLITANGGVAPALTANTVTVRLGRGSGGVGDGTFRIGKQYPAGNRPFHVVAADFDEDGILDLGVADQGGGQVSILRGLGVSGVGDGTFAAPVGYPVGTNPFYVAVGDFNEDGILDVVVANNGSSNVSVLLGQGSGGVGNGLFDASVAYGTVGANPAAIQVGDFNTDGISDLAVTVYTSGNVAILRGAGIGGVGNGTFSFPLTFFAGAGCYDMVQADFTGDGIMDLAVANNSGNVYFLRGLGGSSMFAAANTYPAGGNPGPLAAADWNEDGHLDLVTANANVDSVTVLLGGPLPGIPTGAFGSPSNYLVGDYPLNLAVGDLNEDGHADLAVVSWASSDVQVLLGACALPPEPMPAPHIDAVRDVPADQGGKVFVVWRRSEYDGDLRTTVTNYRVWRRIPPDAIPAPLAGPDAGESANRLGDGFSAAGLPWIARLDAGQITYWEALATLPAQRLEGYGYTSATTRDSLPGDNPFTAFFVTALTSDPDVFYDSSIDSGYSVDNLAPAAPTPFLGTWGPGGVALHWGVSPAQDRAGYRLYRGPAPDFAPAPANFVASLPDTGFVDLNGSTVDYYKLTVVDIHGNESVAALASPPLATPVELSLVEAIVETGMARLSWLADRGAGVVARLERRAVDSQWAAIAELTADGSGLLIYEDRAVATGGRFGYRLTNLGTEGRGTGPEVWLDVPGFALAIQRRGPNPSFGGRLWVDFTLASTSPGRLEVFDAAGRRVFASDAAGPGVHQIEVGGGERLAPGVYLLRLTQDGTTVAGKAVLLQ